MPHSTDVSRSWRNYFLANRASADDLFRADSYRLTSRDRRTIQHSIQQFQLGEGSKGRRLLRRGLAHGRAAQDGYFLRALVLFVKEEQRHSAYLAHFMRAQNIPTLERHWVDSVFRTLRGLAGLELSLRVLTTAEIIAVPYYRALREATPSPLLRSICTRILADEAAHLRFQASMLSRLKPGRSARMRSLVTTLHRLFLGGTALVVWIEHRPVFLAAGCTIGPFLLVVQNQMKAFADNFSGDRLPQAGGLSGQESGVVRGKGAGETPALQARVRGFRAVIRGS
jgi:hypothetical protein